MKPCTAVVCCSLAVAVAAPARAAIEFNRDVRPILSDKCFQCHGPSGHREADLRLDTFAGATESAIIPGKPDESALLSRIASDDPDIRMPPEGDPLSEDEIELLRQWNLAAAWFRPPRSHRPRRA